MTNARKKKEIHIHGSIIIIILQFILTQKRTKDSKNAKRREQSESWNIMENEMLLKPKQQLSCQTKCILNEKIRTSRA